MKRFLFVLLGLVLLMTILGQAWAGTTLYKNRPGKNARIEIYTTSWCPYCRKAEAFLRANGIDFVNYDIEKDQAAAKRKAQLDGRKGVPLAVINGKVVYGFSEEIYRSALGLDSTSQ